MKKVSTGLAILSFSASVIMLTGCWGTETAHPEKAYEYWTGKKPGNSIEVIKGHYWRSPHFTKESTLFLELIPTRVWRDSFFNQREFSTIPNYETPTNAPDWFKPSSKNTVIWQSTGSLVCWEWPDSNRLFIYDYQ